MSQVNDHLYTFNHIILNLQGVEAKIDDEDKTLILLCLLLNSNDNLHDTMLYGIATIIIDVKDSLIPKELKGTVFASKYAFVSGLFGGKGRITKRDGGNQVKSCSKSNVLAKNKCYK